jgi:hypothetical protein
VNDPSDSWCWTGLCEAEIVIVPPAPSRELAATSTEMFGLRGGARREARDVDEPT